MVNLCYSTFMQLVKEHYSYGIEAEVLARDLLSEILPDEEYKKFEGDTGKKYLGFLWNRDRDIPKNVRESVILPQYKAACINYFKNVVVLDINPALEDDFYTKMESLISSDDTITPKKKASLHKIIAAGDKGKYLSEVFLYALAKQNKDTTPKMDKDTIPLLSQVDQTCPLCHEPLIKVVKGKTLYSFTITRIYPEFLDPSLKDQYDAVRPKPTEPDDITNKICLCDACSLDYVFNPSVDVYDKLLKLKKLSLFEGAASSTLAKYEIEEQIVDILNKLANTDPEGSVIRTFRMKPLDPCHKIPKDKYLLIKSIKDDNEVFFWFIRDYISQLDSTKSSFTIIASEIKTSFLKLESEGHDHNEIFEALIEWIMNKNLLSASYRAAAHIIVSYFVQSCEVFHEISE